MVGRLPTHSIRWLSIPYWLSLWFGVFATSEGLLQFAAGAFVIGSYFLAEHTQHRQRRSTPPHSPVPRPQGS
jgi:high-affinity iron transporter